MDVRRVPHRVHLPAPCVRDNDVGVAEDGGANLPLRPCEHQLVGRHPRIEVPGPGCNDAAGQSKHGSGHVLNVVRAAGVQCCAGRVLDGAKKEVEEIDAVGAHVVEQASPRDLAIHPPGTCSLPAREGLVQVETNGRDAPHRPAPQQVSDEEKAGKRAAVVRDPQRNPGCVERLEHAPALSVADRHGFLDQAGFSRVCNPAGQVGMAVGMCGNVDGVDPLIPNELVGRRVHARHPVALCVVLGLLPVASHDCHERRPPGLPEAGPALDLGHIPAADHSPSHVMHPDLQRGRVEGKLSRPVGRQMLYPVNHAVLMPRRQGVP